MDRIGLNAGSNTDPDFYLNAGPDQDPVPGSQTNADPCGSRSCQILKSQKVEFLHEKYALSKVDYRSKNIPTNLKVQKPF